MKVESDVLYRCCVYAAPLRADPDDRSEMATQLLFGESASILNRERQWLQVQCAHDGYIGWMDEKQLWPDSEGPVAVVANRTIVAHSPRVTVSVPCGGFLPHWNEHGWSFHQHCFAFEAGVKVLETPLAMPELLAPYLGAPYLWGGRTPTGIDCSGLVQMLGRRQGIVLPRDAADQYERCMPIDRSEAGTFDYAFVPGKTGRMAHVGLMLDDKHLVHAYGRVRIDSVSKDEIISSETKQASHANLVFARLDLPKGE